ncbi:hypothetical protein DVH24_035871 [Malus domestica]|uniref:DUF8039 domain-containing protein n=1 Tax=Malus domestica TaxID=3750 RepID=A0A498JTF0_MALDO|nr:hypothetical protein DVH24_035871 [Malus domestica]
MDFDGLPDGDEMHSSDDVNEAKKRKGRGPTMLDYNAMSKAKQIGVQFNDKGQHFGVGSASLSSSVGILARQLIPVTYASWDEVPTILKDKLWAVVKMGRDRTKVPCHAWYAQDRTQRPRGYTITIKLNLERRCRAESSRIGYMEEDDEEDGVIFEKDMGYICLKMNNPFQGEVGRKNTQNLSRGTARSTHFWCTKRRTERLVPFHPILSHQKYDLAPCRKKIILTQMSGCLRTYKATLTKQIRSFDDGPDAMEQMQLLKPANVEKQADWDKFVKHRCSPKFDAISEKFKKLKSFHTLPHVMRRKGYARLEDELDDIKLANEMPTTDNGSIKDDALSQALGPEHRGRLRGGGYGVTPSRYDAQTYASMSNRELRDRLQNVEGKLREVFDLVLAKQQNEGNGKETNTNNAIQVSTNRPHIQCDRRSAQEADDASRQASKASSQRSSPNIERDSIKRKEGSKAISQLQPVGILRGSSCKLLNWLRNGQVVATGEIESTNPEAKGHHMVLGPDCWKVWVTVVRVENISLYRPPSEFRVLEDAISSTIAWPSNKYAILLVILY